MNDHDTNQPEEVVPPAWALEAEREPRPETDEHLAGEEESASPIDGAPDSSEVQDHSAPESPQEEPETDNDLRARTVKEVISGAQMANKSYRREQFLIGPKLLPVGGRMLITAETGTGKSALALHIAACIITGKPLFGLLRAKKDVDHGKPYFPVIKPCDVFYLDFELPEQIRWNERLYPLTREFGTDFLKRIYFPKKPSELRLDPGESFDNLRNLVRAVKPGVTIIDPLSSTHSVDENTNSLKQPLNRIDQLIEDSGTTVILIHHSSVKKARNAYGDVVEKTAKERPRGHTCLVDWADVQLHLEALNAKDRRRYDDDEETETAKLLGLEFGKTRYCQTPRGRKIEADIEEMYFGRPRTPSPAKGRETEGGAATAIMSTT